MNVESQFYKVMTHKKCERSIGLGKCLELKSSDKDKNTKYHCIKNMIEDKFPNPLAANEIRG